MVNAHVLGSYVAYIVHRTYQISLIILRVDKAGKREACMWPRYGSQSNSVVGFQFCSCFFNYMPGLET